MSTFKQTAKREAPLGSVEILVKEVDVARPAPQTMRMHPNR